MVLQRMRDRSEDSLQLLEDKFAWRHEHTIANPHMIANEHIGADEYIVADEQLLQMTILLLQVSREHISANEHVATLVQGGWPRSTKKYRETCATPAFQQDKWLGSEECDLRSFASTPLQHDWPACGYDLSTYKTGPAFVGAEPT